MLEDRKIKTRHLVESATGVVRRFHELQTQGKMTEADARSAALATLKQLRYEKTDYFWVNDMQPRVLMHPIKPELDGKDASSIKDPEGNALFVEFVDTVKKSGSGFVEYLWPKPGFDHPVPKVSGFAPWGWIIGSGIYIDDVDQTFRAHALSLGLIILVLAGLIGGLLSFLVHQISSDIHGLKQTMTTIHDTTDFFVAAGEGQGKRRAVGNSHRLQFHGGGLSGAHS